jgi:alpha-tubulin suppressor-like RCC1 family protein
MGNIKAKQIQPGSEGQVLRVIGGKIQYTNKYGIGFNDKSLSPLATNSQDSDSGIRISETPSGFVWVCRNGVVRKLGDGTKTTDCYFGDPNETLIFSSAIGSEQRAVALADDGSAWCWGSGGTGANGDNTIAVRSSPVSVVGSHSFIAITPSNGNTVFLKADGTVWGCGQGVGGTLGNDTIISRSSPVSVIGTHSFISISAGQDWHMALKADGTVWTWGANSSGQLGDNTIANRSSPVSVVGTHSFISVSGGEAHTLALKADGTVWAWGFNGAGAVTGGLLGDNTTANRSSPISVIGTHSFIKIAAGKHSLGLKADGTVWAWGNNNTGNLGDNTVAHRSSPISVVGTHSFLAITAGGGPSAGQGLSYGLKSDGRVWSWGLGTQGQMGDNTITNKSSPVSVVGAHSFINVAVQGDGDHPQAIKSDGSVWGWGIGTVGQLGDYTANNRSSPISVIALFAGTAARNYSEILAGDQLVWNGVTAGNLAVTDRIDLIYVV